MCRWIVILIGLALSLINTGGTQKTQALAKPQTKIRSLSSNTRTDTAVNAVVQKYRMLFNYYYKRAWRYNQQAKGSIKIRLTIQDDGHVKRVEVLSDSVHIRRLTQFILKHARQWAFDPEETGGCVVDLIFPFTPV